MAVVPTPNHLPLEGAVAEAAVSNLMVEYPRVVRSVRDYPIPNQSNGLLSFMLFKEPKILKSGKPIYGFIKLRGNWADSDQCKAKASEIVRQQDSAHQIKIAEVGAWVPITEDTNFVKENVEVKTNMTEQDRLREIAAKENRDKQEQVAREIREREQEVKNGHDYNEDPDSIDYYTMKRVVWLRLQENIDMLRNQITSLEGKLNDTRVLLGELDEQHPTYIEDWIENYNKERRKAGIPDYIPSTREEEAYKKFVKQ